MGHDLTCAWIGEDDISGVVSLFNAVVAGYARSPAYWRWSNLQMPAGGGLAAAAKIDGRVVAHYSVIPLDVFIDGVPATIAMGQQAVVHPKFRNLKILKDLTDFILQEARGRFEFFYSFPNNTFAPVNKRILGWEELQVFDADMIRIKDLPPAPARREIRLLKALPEMSWLNAPGPGICVRKTTDYLNWRFVRHPLNHYTVLGAFDGETCIGYLVLKIHWRNQDQVLIGHFVDMDAQGADTSVLEDLLSVAAQFFAFYEIEEVVFWNKDVRFEDFFKRIIAGRRFATNMVILGGRRPLDDKLKNPGQWSFSMAVSDVF